MLGVSFLPAANHYMSTCMGDDSFFKYGDIYSPNADLASDWVVEKICESRKKIGNIFHMLN